MTSDDLSQMLYTSEFFVDFLLDFLEKLPAISRDRSTDIASRKHPKMTTLSEIYET